VRTISIKSFAVTFSAIIASTGVLTSEAVAVTAEPVAVAAPAQDEARSGYPGGMNEAEWSYCRVPSHTSLCNKASKHADVALAEAKNRWASSLHNGKGDAFRHCYWNARMAIDFGKGTAKGFADRHEQNPNQPAIEKKMDLFNNDVGRTVGEASSSYVDAIDRCSYKLRHHRLRIISNGQLVRS
jgi:hypothetical protein